MALPAYLTLEGQKQGKIAGGVTQKGREGSILVFAVDHTVSTPRDVASGQATGKRVHQPLRITKEIDRASPLLYDVLTQNERLKSFELRFYRPARARGNDEQYYTIRLTNASIAEIRMHKPNTNDPATARFADCEEISFTYQRIEWTIVDGGIVASDDWSAPIA